MSYLWEGSCLVCRRAHVLFVGGIMSCLQESSCLICRRAHVLFVGGFMSYLQEGSCLICRRAHVLFALLVFVFLKWCPAYIVLCFCFGFLRLVSPVLPVSLDCPFSIGTSVFSNFYSPSEHTVSSDHSQILHVDYVIIISMTACSPVSKRTVVFGRYIYLVLRYLINKKVKLGPHSKLKSPQISKFEK